MENLKLKASNYNFFFNEKTGDKIVCYNSRTNALAKMNKQLYSDFENFISGQDNTIDSEQLKSLIYGGFLINTEVDELNILRKRMNTVKYNSNSLGLTIATTLQCNFKCPYCYEKGGQSGRMSLEVQDKIINMIEMKKDIIKDLNITWYGGEPLLAFDVIEYLGSRLIDICEQNNIKYSSSMVTNGYLLTVELATKLAKKLKVSHIQVTIDGPPETHNRTRILHNDGPTFDIIMENLEACKDLFDNIGIRVNVNKKNYLKAIDLMNIFEEKKLTGNTNIYFAKVDTIGHEKEDELCFSDEQFDHINRLYRKNIETYITKEAIPEYPTLFGGQCVATNLQGMVITPDGYLYRCWEDVGIKDMATGNLINDTDIIATQRYTANSHKYLMYDPTYDNECKTCKLLPMCMGGCAIKRIKGKERCTNFKYSLEDRLSEFIEYNKKLNCDECLGC